MTESSDSGTMDDSCALEVVARPVVVHRHPKASSSSSDVRIIAPRASPTDCNFPSRTVACPWRPNALVPKPTWLTSYTSSRSSSPSSRTSQMTKFDASRNSPVCSKSGVRNSPRINSQTGPQIQSCGVIAEDVPKSGNVVSLVSTNLQHPETKQMAVIESTHMRAKPTLHENFNNLSPKAKLKNVKQFLNAFEYKQTPATHFNAHKLRPLSRIMDTARMIIYSPQPIKCVEAVFLALYLTAGITDCDRIPLSFKTSTGGQVYQHIVLLVRYGCKFGAFGISRHPDLMTKDISFNSISDVVENYKKAYETADHIVLKIRMGLQVEHKVNSPNFVCWRHLSINPGIQSWEQCCVALENHRLKQNRLWDLWLLTGKGGDPRRKSLTRKAALDNKLLDDVKKKKKVKTQETTLLSLMGARGVDYKPQGPKFADSLSSQQISSGAWTRMERKRDLSLCATKSLTKVRILSSKTSNFFRQNAQYINSNLLSNRKLLGCGLLSSSQGRRMTRISFNSSRGKQVLIGRASKEEEGKHVRRISSKGRHLEDLNTNSTKGKEKSTEIVIPAKGIIWAPKGKDFHSWTNLAS